MTRPGDDRCWAEIGVWGNGDCPELAAAVHCHNCSFYEAAGRSLLERSADQAYVEEWTELLARPKEIRDRELISLTVFRLGDDWLALRTSVVREITENQPVRTVPHRTSAVFRGLVNIRGELHLCVSLRDFLGLENKVASGGDQLSLKVWSRMVMSSKGGDTWVFPVDEVWGLARLRPSEIETVPATVGKDQSTYTRGLFASQGRTVGVLDEELLFYALRRKVF